MRLQTAHAGRIVNAASVFDKNDFSDLIEDFTKTLTYSSILLSDTKKKTSSLPVIHLFTDGSILVKKTPHSSYLILGGEDELYEFISNLYDTDRPYLNLITKTLQKMGESIQPDEETLNTMTIQQGKKIVSTIFKDCSTTIDK